jgi:superfamily II DNA or RNA helicase
MIASPPIPPKTALIAKLWHTPDSVRIRLPEMDADFRRIVRKLGYVWSGSAWERPITQFTGAAADRAAELCAALLAAGFVVDAPDEIVSMAASGNWQPEQKRWVKGHPRGFALRWRGQDENLYDRARMLPGAEYDPDTKSVVVPPLYYEEVIGFAETHDFRFTPEAEERLAQARRDYARTLIPAIEAPAPAPKKRGKVRRCDPAKFADLPARSLTTTTALYPHQVPAVTKLAPLRVGALFMDMGVGKSRCAIELATLRQARTSRVIWFCPVSLKLTIAAEIAKHTTGEAVHVFDDDTAAGNTPEAFWYVVGIESMSASDRVVLAVNQLVDGDAFVIVDESSYIKGHASKRTMRITEIARRARYRLLLTGTPISQGVEDLYAQMRFLSPDILGYGSFYAFANNHLEYSDKYPGLIRRSLRTDALADKISPYIYQVTKEECLDLPAKLYDAVYCGLTPEQRAAYEQAKYEILLGKDTDDLTSYVIFRLFTALQQIVSGYWRREGELIELPHERLDTLRLALNGIPDGEKVIIWCKFVHSLRQIADAIPGAALYYGELSEHEREAELARFRGGDSRFLIATQATGGHGLTLNEAHYHVFYENEFKYSHRIQAEDRSHRIGQTQPVTYIDLWSRSGIDERIQKALAKKEDVVKAFRREVKKINTEEAGALMRGL